MDVARTCGVPRDPARLDDACGGGADRAWGGDGGRGRSGDGGRGRCGDGGRDLGWHRPLRVWGRQRGGAGPREVGDAGGGGRIRAGGQGQLDGSCALGDGRRAQRAKFAIRPPASRPRRERDAADAQERDAGRIALPRWPAPPGRGPAGDERHARQRDHGRGGGARSPGGCPPGAARPRSIRRAPAPRPHSRTPPPPPPPPVARTTVARAPSSPRTACRPSALASLSPVLPQRGRHAGLGFRRRHSRALHPPNGHGQD